MTRKRGLALFFLGAAGLGAACAPARRGVMTPLDATGGAVRFAPSREAFYKKAWQDTARAAQPQICAGFVHHKNFGHYLRFGPFKLEMHFEAILGGTATREGGRITGWQDGKVLRTIRRPIPLKASANNYVWCGRLRKGGTWKVGALRLVFHLRGAERTNDEQLATGILPITP